MDMSACTIHNPQFRAEIAGCKQAGHRALTRMTVCGKEARDAG
jgi:hypothetical protein